MPSSWPRPRRAPPPPRAALDAAARQSRRRRPGRRPRSRPSSRPGSIGAVLLVAASLLPADRPRERDGREPGAGRRPGGASARARAGSPTLLDDSRRATARTRTTLSDLADEYLAGSTARRPRPRGRQRSSCSSTLEPERADAYERIMAPTCAPATASTRGAAHDSYAGVATRGPGRGRVLRRAHRAAGRERPRAATAAFDRFLELAPDDPRADMVRGLRDEAAGELAGLATTRLEHPLEGGSSSARERSRKCSLDAAQVRRRGAGAADRGRHRSATPTARAGPTRTSRARPGHRQPGGRRGGWRPSGRGGADRPARSSAAALVGQRRAGRGRRSR